MIDAAKAEVKAMTGLKAGSEIVFIEDRVTAPVATYDGHAEGALRTINPDAPVKAFGDVGEMGQYTTFDVTPSAYTFNVDASGHVTTSGTGAVGFIVYDASGNVIGFYNTSSFKLPATAGSDYVIKATAGNGSLTEATKDESIVVGTTDFPRTDKWYAFMSKGQANRYVDSQGAGEGLIGTSQASSSAVKSDQSMHWRFQPRNASGTEFDIINRVDGSYIDPTVSWNSQERTTATQPAAGWKVEPAGDYYYISSGSTQLNQTGSGLNYQIYNWGSGSNTEDNCLFTISAVDDYNTPSVATLSETALDELSGNLISVAASAADELRTRQWYVMYDRGLTESYRHGYLYENVSTHALYNTLTVPSGSATDACKYLVRLIDAGSGKYYIQTGYGNYFGQIEASKAVPLTASQLQRITVAKINNTSGHFYLQGESGGVILDANECESFGDATVVGYGTTVPTSTGGNNDWAFYPVTLTRQVALNSVGDASYATLYLPYDVTTDEGTKAYYITEVADGQAKLTELTGGEIAAKTAVVLVSANQASVATLTVTSGLVQQVSSTENLLKGTLTSMSLDLSDGTPYYSLGRLDGKIGFYKFSDGAINLGANKAYLNTTTPTSQVKGFALSFDLEDGISQIVNRKPVNDKCYELSGRRVAKPTRGIYMVGGKKILVK